MWEEMEIRRNREKEEKEKKKKNKLLISINNDDEKNVTFHGYDRNDRIRNDNLCQRCL